MVLAFKDLSNFYNLNFNDKLILGQPTYSNESPKTGIYRINILSSKFKNNISFILIHLTIPFWRQKLGIFNGGLLVIFKISQDFESRLKNNHNIIILKIFSLELIFNSNIILGNYKFKWKL